MPFITVSTGGGPDLPEGAYPVVLVKITGPKTVTAQRGPKAGQDIELLDWTFAVADGGEHDGVEIEVSTSMASGPKSKMFAFLTALHSGKPPAVGANFEIADLVGKYAMATVARDDQGWLRITNVGAIPASMMQRGLAAATGAPVVETPTPAASPIREAVTAGVAGTSSTDADGLPF